MQKQKAQIIVAQLQQLLKGEPVLGIDFHDEQLRIYFSTREAYETFCDPLEQHPDIKVFCGRKAVRMSK